MRWKNNENCTILTSETKTYEGEVTLGFSTTTEDASGEVVETKNVDRTITRKEVESPCGINRHD